MPCRSMFHEQCFGSPLLVRSIFQDLIPSVGVVGFSGHRFANDDHDFVVPINFDTRSLKPCCHHTIDGTFDAALEARLSTHDNTHPLIWVLSLFGVPMSSASNIPY